MTVTQSNKIRTNVYLDSNIKNEAKKIFKRYGISLSDAINMFLTQSIVERGLPFELKMPNDETIKAIEDVQNGVELEEITLDQLKEDMKKCISN